LKFLAVAFEVFDCACVGGVIVVGVYEVVGITADEDSEGNVIAWHGEFLPGLVIGIDGVLLGAGPAVGRGAVNSG
jgi:hypothetical protein